MSNFEPKKIALIRILQILEKHSDIDHPLLQSDIARYLEEDYNIFVDRKTIGRNLEILREAGYTTTTTRAGCYLSERSFEDAELRMLIDSVLSSRYITAKHTKDLIERLCGLSNKYFRSHIKNVYTINDWQKTENPSLFYSIELIDEAIERQLQLCFDYNKFGVDKKMHKSSTVRVTPYQMILHNQRYYLMCYHELHEHLSFLRIDYITNMQIDEHPATPIRNIPGYESGINYKDIASTLPYMYSDKPKNIELIADKKIVDQIIDWFGTDIKISEIDDEKIKVILKASPNAMEFWAMQYLKHVEVVSPVELREKIKTNIETAAEKYK